MRYLLCLLLLCACQKSVPLSHFAGTAFKIPYHIQIGHQLSDEEKEIACHAIEEVFTLIDTTFNHWNPHSEISRFNDCSENTPFTSSLYLTHLLKLSQTISDITQNRFDPTIGVLTHALKTDQQIDGPCGINHLKIEDTHLIKTTPLRIDLDGISKGHAIDLLIQKLASLKHKNIYVEWGGEMRAIGGHPSGRPWRVLIRGAEETQIDLTDCAVATSGDQLQQYGDFTHIIDPQTKKALPTRGHSITVKAPSAALADGLATALMLYTADEIKELKHNLPNIEVWNENGIL
ncbi:MAG: FAD:protein FMN transferase [Chlamydiia bacterium]|nr:FAD:protein FMN transferase [Chlamydiia bacterium]MCP5508806.1 FAD:protein FMN transferase [Chlamydiales bacterium]